MSQVTTSQDVTSHITRCHKSHHKGKIAVPPLRLTPGFVSSFCCLLLFSLINFFLSRHKTGSCDHHCRKSQYRTPGIFSHHLTNPICPMAQIWRWIPSVLVNIRCGLFSWSSWPIFGARISILAGMLVFSWSTGSQVAWGRKLSYKLTALHRT